MNETNSSTRLGGRVALITGGAQGIGRAIATLFQKQGACVFILDCDSVTGKKTATELSEQIPSRPVKYLAADLREPAEIQNATNAIKKFHDRVDVLVNNAGIELEKSLEQLTVADWDLVLSVNLRGAFLLTRAIVPLFPESGGSIVNISSIHASHAFPDSIPYACSKAGMVALTRNLALELASRHIRVNCICPGYIDTRLWEEYLRSSANPGVLAEQTAALHLVGRRGMPNDVSEAALFLASDSSAFITGTDLVVDGGLTVRAHH
ncbi:MAG TPA: SDR family oxidoreductase [Candidatus Sulfotelmatobacter sp.]|jgi:NAD(P)-dependent dehydrogenase (short-subunit alcohol dehydrogenase family)|nr:SDR family oxidoreductase [Candidatus Sulfotelmatobacter sp.]